jgi:hypothetical protein
VVQVGGGERRAGCRTGRSAATILVAGALANKPLNGGEAWVRLNWVLGLARLGHRVHLVEQLAPEVCVDRRGSPAPFRSSLNASYFRAVVRSFGLERCATLVCGEGAETLGLTYRELGQLAASADVLVNISGHLRLRSLLERVRRRVFVDLDPGFTQAWHERGEADAGVAGHDAHFTVGGNVGQPECAIPTAGIRWRPVRPPLVLALWPAAPPRPAGPFTTVAKWRHPYGPIALRGREYGLKHHEFRRVIDLPRRAGAAFEIALDIDPGDRADREALEQHGWRIREAGATVPGPLSFRRFVRDSGAEFSVAQGIYVETRSGWFSDRTACYLASGRPAVVQATGFEDAQPTGEGLLAFHTFEEAVERVEEVAADYERHARAARRLAEECFDSDRVLAEFLAEVGVDA